MTSLQQPTRVFFRITSGDVGYRAVIFYDLPFFTLGKGNGAGREESFQSAKRDSLTRLAGWGKLAASDPDPEYTTEKLNEMIRELEKLERGPTHQESSE